MYDEPPKKPRPKGLGLSGNALSKQQERRVAKRTGGICVPASGAFKGLKGDVSHSLHLFECKTTAKKSMRLEQKWLTKISREAAMKHKDPALVFSFPDMASDVDQDWVALPLKVLVELMNRAEDK
jgi:hypothetical protein